MLPLLSFIFGVLGWTLTEYIMHRFLAHHGKPRGRFGREHLAHHAQPAQFTPLRVKLLMAIPISTSIFGTAWISLGPWLGTIFTVGFLGAYLGYEVLHWSLHIFPPRTAFGRWARRHHFTHHFQNAKANHGVTSSLWDHVFNTFVPSASVRIPARFTPEWLTDHTGAIQPQFQSQFSVHHARAGKA
jgi:sterol desaturase/sphingolipid hydroxylase (fatty acid hydroxylase superfamily)